MKKAVERGRLRRGSVIMVGPADLRQLLPRGSQFWLRRLYGVLGAVLDNQTVLLLREVPGVHHDLLRFARRSAKPFCPP